MPAGKGKNKNKKGQKKQKHKTGASVDSGKLLKEILKDYDVLCEKQGVSPCMTVKKALRQAIEDGKIVHKFLFEPGDRREVQMKEDEELTDDYFAIMRGEKASPPLTKREATKAKKQAEKENKPLVKLKPLLEVLRSKRYVYIQTLNVWGMFLDHDDMIFLGAMIAGPYQFERIELMDCFIHPYTITRFAPYAAISRTLVDINLDFNEFGDEGCRGLCEGLLRTRYLLTLSLCYCELTQISGVYLGRLISETPIRNIYLDGNHLESEGVIALLDAIIEASEGEKREREEEARKKLQAEQEAAEKAKKRDWEKTDDELTPSTTTDDISSTSGAKKQGKKKGKRGGKRRGKRSGKRGRRDGPTPPPPSGPQIEKLHLADNAIDHMGRGGNFAPMRCMQLIRILISCSKWLQEIDLWGNDIGDLGSRQLLEGLQIRKADKLAQMGLRIGHKVNPEIFDAITKLAPGVKKKKSRGKKKRSG